MARVPDGPRGVVRTTWNVMTRPHAYYAELAERYGPTFHARAANGELVATGDPELVRQIFALTSAQARPFAVDSMTEVIGSGSVLLQSGHAHQRSRRLLMPAFTGEAMAGYARRMREIAAEEVSGWPDRGVFAVQDGFLAISLRIIVEVIFGARSGAEAERLAVVTERLVSSMHPSLLFSAALRVELFGLGPWARYVRARRALDEALLEIIEARRASGVPGSDVLGRLLAARDEDGSALSDRELLDQLLTLLVAGHETTSIAMAWAVWRLHRSADDLARVRDGLPAPADALDVDHRDNTWLGLSIQESLRMCPIAPDMLRTLLVDVELGPWSLPAGSSVAVIAAITHRDPTLYPDPDRFHPGRFEDFQPRPWMYYPFGGGIRRCIGASFALCEMAQVLGVVLAHATFELVDRDVKPVRRTFTVGPSRGVRVRCSSPC